MFATALALEEKLELFFFDQWNMRAHLRQCFEDGMMKMFLRLVSYVEVALIKFHGLHTKVVCPWCSLASAVCLQKWRVKKSAVKTTEEVQVYCKCRMPELPGEQLIECTNCKEWYHLDACIDVAPATCLDSSVPWFCHKCL